MSALEILSRINKKLDEGWKMSDQSCPICHTIIMGNPATKEFYCVKCQMPAKIFQDDEEGEIEIVSSSGNGKSANKNKNGSIDSFEKEEEYENMIFKREAERRKSDEMSKKMGEYLLQGWTMLEDCCLDCLFPLMRSKKGEVICVGCGPVKPVEEKKPIQKVEYNKPANVNNEERKIDRSKELEIVMEKEEPKKQPVQKKEEKPVSEQKPIPQPQKEPEQPKQPVIQSRPVGDFYTAGRFDQSIDFYSTLTKLLEQEAKQLANSVEGLSGNLKAVRELINLQISIDNAKKDILNFTAKKD